MPVVSLPRRLRIGTAQPRFRCKCEHFQIMFWSGATGRQGPPRDATAAGVAAASGDGADGGSSSGGMLGSTAGGEADGGACGDDNMDVDNEPAAAPGVAAPLAKVTGVIVTAMMNIPSRRCGLLHVGETVAPETHPLGPHRGLTVSSPQGGGCGAVRKAVCNTSPDSGKPDSGKGFGPARTQQARKNHDRSQKRAGRQKTSEMPRGSDEPELDHGSRRARAP